MLNKVIVSDPCYGHLINVLSEDSSVSTTHDAEIEDNGYSKEECIPNAVAVVIDDRKIENEKKEPFGAPNKRKIGVWVGNKVFPHVKFTDEDHVRSLSKMKVDQIKEKKLSVDEGVTIFLDVRICISYQMHRRRSYAHHRQLKEKLFCKFMNIVQRNQLFVLLLF